MVPLESTAYALVITDIRFFADIYPLPCTAISPLCGSPSFSVSRRRAAGPSGVTPLVAHHPMIVKEFETPLGVAFIVVRNDCFIPPFTSTALHVTLCSLQEMGDIKQLPSNFMSFRLSRIHPAFQRRYLGMWLGWIVACPCAAVGIVMSAPGQGYVFLVYVILCGVVPPLLIMQYAHNVKAREERRQLETLNRRPSRSKVDVDDKEIAALHREWDEWLKEKCEDIHGSDLTGDEEPCAICLVDYTSDDEVVRLPCRHEYHTDCIRLMFDSFPRNGTLYHRCPLCRVEIGRLEQASSESPHDSVDVSPPSPVSS
ncbi:hypothetical protein FOZ62_016281 [Perkinsus olseni]|uniref:RING-type domain-containing protein n=1 Tax=Perkinsus olseni TaxID=32597 RepID=A0A7J6RE08_PEROL|nr:hypothetical protein FOZ62_016281 [Perkinsus olseni]